MATVVELEYLIKKRGAIMTVAETIHHLETLAMTGGEIDLTANEFHAIQLSITVLKTLPLDLVQLIDAIMAKEPE